jgi:type VI secretion system protein VasD
MLFSARPIRRLCLIAVPLSASVLLGGCASMAAKAIVDTGILDSALNVVGLQVAKDAPAEPQAEKAAKPIKVPFRLHAGQVLNTDEDGNSLSLIARIYKLKDGDAFLQAPYDAFKDPATEKAALGDALIEVKEVMLKPGGKFEAIQVLAPEAQNIGIVALFRSPAEHRWRFMFNAKDAAKAGITVGAHGCALSVAEGTAVGVAPETMRLAGVQCD